MSKQAGGQLTSSLATPRLPDDYDHAVLLHTVQQLFPCEIIELSIENVRAGTDALCLNIGSLSLAPCTPI